MKIKVTYYLEVISSWCYWAEPTWSELRLRYDHFVAFDWKIAQMPPEAYPVSKAQCEWFYRRSGTITRSPFMLNAGWFEPGIKDWLVPNRVAKAARQLGVDNDIVRLGIADAALKDGLKVGRMEVAVAVAAKAGRLNKAKLTACANSKAVADRIMETSNEFNALQVNQRPAFVIENEIGDRAVFSGIINLGVLSAAIEAVAADQAAYDVFKAHFGKPPS